MTEGGRGAGPASPGRAAFLSFVLPGLGQIALGSISRGLVLGLPILATVVVAAFFILADHADLISGLFDPTVILALVVLDVLLGLLHLIAIGDAYWLARRRAIASAWTRRSGSPKLLAGLLVVTFAVHGAIGAIGVQAYDTLDAVFTSPGAGYTIPAANFGPTGSLAPGATPFSVSPLPGPAWAADGRLNILLIGNDGGPGRWELRTDTMVMLSVDVTTGNAALFGVPRNIVNVPLAAEDAGIFPNDRYPDLLNSLYVYAVQHPKQFPGATPEEKGFRAVTGAIQQLLGVPLDGVVTVNLNGFVDLVDALGGLWIRVPGEVYDTAYPLEDGSGYVTIDIKPGCRHLDGHLALAFARSRHQDSDYQRMGRQQLTIEALAKQVDPIGLLPKVPDLLSIAKNNFWTTFQPSDIGRLARFAATIDTAHIQNVLFIPPTYPEYLGTKAIKSIQKAVKTVFSNLAATPSPGAGASANPSASTQPAEKSCPA
jgi:LCP family protein required for cell wall assembly